MSEHDLAVACADFLALFLPPDATYHHSPNEAKRSARVGARLKSEGMQPGEPDIQVVYRGRSYYVELKAPRQYPSEAQRARQLVLVRCGCPVLGCCRSVEAMVEFLSQHVPLRGRITA